MAQPTNTFSRVSLSGVREGLTNDISLISPQDTPLYSMLERKSCDSVFPEWQTDSLATANKDNALIDGDTFVNRTRSATLRIGNHCQTFSDVMEVTRRANIANSAGRTKEMAYQLVKAGKQIKLDVEAALTQNNAAVAPTNSVAGKLASFETCIATASNISHGAGGATAAWTTGAPTTAITDGTTRSFTEALLKSTIQSSVTTGFTPKILLLNATQRAAFSGFPGLAVNRVDLKKPTAAVIIATADVYVSDFGPLTVVTDLQMRSRTALLIDPDYAHIKVHDPMDTKPLADTSDSVRKAITFDLTLAVTNPSAHAKIADLT
jgi:hypothetical protein